MPYAITVKPGERVNLASIDTRQDGGLTKEEARARLEELGPELDELQELLYAAGDHAVLVVVQGMDTSGKDGMIRKVFSHVNPIGCRVWPFKVPNSLELAHDFLWRIHQKTPEKGYMTVFNRSHYEDVLVVRVDQLVPKPVWQARYEQINQFEALLAASNTIIVKFFLHISREEQLERLRAREQEAEKAWKLSVDDWRKREQWNAYQTAYQDAIRKCSTSHAPWHIIPADRKWFRDLAVMETMVESLRPFRAKWLAALRERGTQERAAIDALRQKSGGASAAEGA